MKWGEIWARSARTSASASRARDTSSSASSTWVETQRATSLVARMRPGRVSDPKAPSVPTTSSPTTTGTITAERMAQYGSLQLRSAAVMTLARPVATTPAASAAAWGPWWSATPSQARRSVSSVRATAGQPSSWWRARIDLAAAVRVSPARNGGAASLALWRTL